MSATDNEEPTKSYKSFLKPVKFWQRNKKTDTADEEEPGKVETKSALSNKLSLPTPSLGLVKKPEKTAVADSCVALRETAKGEVYKLSIINDSGIYLPPSPCEHSKRDHWLHVDQETLAFRLPDRERLTTHAGQHDFFTPSSTFFHAMTSQESLNDTLSLSASSHHSGVSTS